jgi:hypothetical protein
VRVEKYAKLPGFLIEINTKVKIFIFHFFSANLWSAHQTYPEKTLSPKLDHSTEIKKKKLINVLI